MHSANNKLLFVMKIETVSNHLNKIKNEWQGKGNKAEDFNHTHKHTHLHKRWIEKDTSFIRSY